MTDRSDTGGAHFDGDGDVVAGDHLGGDAQLLRGGDSEPRVWPGGVLQGEFMLRGGEFMFRGGEFMLRGGEFMPSCRAEAMASLESGWGGGLMAKEGPARRKFWGGGDFSGGTRSC
eukprot:1182170-Prorocentrum_minimum.AAC.2